MCERSLPHFQFRIPFISRQFSLVEFGKSTAIELKLKNERKKRSACLKCSFNFWSESSFMIFAGDCTWEGSRKVFQKSSLFGMKFLSDKLRKTYKSYFSRTSLMDGSFDFMIFDGTVRGKCHNRTFRIKFEKNNSWLETPRNGVKLKFQVKNSLIFPTINQLGHDDSQNQKNFYQKFLLNKL